MKKTTTIAVNAMTGFMNFMFMYLLTVTASLLKEIYYIEMDGITMLVVLGLISVLSMALALWFRSGMIATLEEQEEK